MGKWLNKFMGNMSKVTSDKSDNNSLKPDWSLLSPPSQHVFSKNIGNMVGSHSDKSDNNNLKPDLSVPSRDIFNEDSLGYGFEERLSIAEYDGYQMSNQSQRIAYLDAFISILSALSEDDPHWDWLNDKIHIALATLETQNFPTLS